MNPNLELKKYKFSDWSSDNLRMLGFAAWLEACLIHLRIVFQFVVGHGTDKKEKE